MQKLILISVVALLVAAFGCEKSSNSSYIDQADCTGVDASANTYTKNIKDILDNNCALSGCHNASSRESGVDLSTYAKAKTSFENDDCLCTIHHGAGCNPMPQGSPKLDAATIQQLDCWAKNGYAE